MSINPLKYHQLILHFSYQLRDERKYIRNWQLTPLCAAVNHSTQQPCVKCCTHTHARSVHKYRTPSHRRREWKGRYASLSKATVRSCELSTGRCHMNSNRCHSADMWKADTTDMMVAQASPHRALHLTQGKSNSYKWPVSLQPDPAAIFSLTAMTSEKTLWLWAHSNFGHTARWPAKS